MPIHDLGYREWKGERAARLFRPWVVARSGISLVWRRRWLRMVVMQTWDIPLRILAASAVLMIPTTALAIAYSSLTSESRYATFAWFATWAMGFVSYQLLTSTTAIAGAGGFGRGRRRWENVEFDLDRYRLLSPYHTLGKVQSWVFDLDTSTASVLPSVMVLVGITIVSTWIVRRRIIARLSV